MPKRRYSQTVTVVRKRARYATRRSASRRYTKTSLRRKGYRTANRVYSYTRYVSQFANVQRSTLPGTANTDPWVPSENKFYVTAETNATYEIDASFAPNFADIKNHTEFTNLYDRYMLMGVKYTWKLSNNPNSEHNFNSGTNSQTAIGTNYYPELFVAPDYDDTGVITKSQIQEYQSARRFVLQPNRVATYFLRAPRTRTSLIDGSTQKSAGVNRAYQWIDMNQTTIDHFGIKMAICAPSPSRVLPRDFEVHMEAKYYFKCRDVR